MLFLNGIKLTFLIMNKPDYYQLQAIKTNKNVLLIASAGAGKTFTIVNKITYLIDQGVNPKEILVLSFTNKTVENLKSKINNNVDIFTFHKLAIDILNYNHITFNICSTNYLDFIINEYFYSLDNPILIKKILKSYNNYFYNDFLNSKYYIELTKLINRFINLYKTNGKNIADLYVYYNKDNLFITLVLNIIDLYNKELKSTNTLDFNDLIILATKYCHNYKKYSYIIIDEFQDISLIRWNLVNKIRLNNNAIFFCVGDDYQSIYNFSGSSIDLFLDFKKNVDNSKIMFLKNTYRNSQELINICSSFITKNGKQIKKELFSNKHLNKPIIIKRYLNPYNTFSRLLDYLITKYSDILVLGRNNFDLNYYLKEYHLVNNSFIYKDKNIRYLTVHSSKGLEADVVIVINMTNGIYGFPSKIKNHKMIDAITYDDNSIIFAEERRLFYVALTRTKNEVYLLTPLFNQSIFIKEIKKIIKKSQNLL